MTSVSYKQIDNWGSSERQLKRTEVHTGYYGKGTKPTVSGTGAPVSASHRNHTGTPPTGRQGCRLGPGCPAQHESSRARPRPPQRRPRTPRSFATEEREPPGTDTVSPGGVTRCPFRNAGRGAATASPRGPSATVCRARGRTGTLNAGRSSSTSPGSVADLSVIPLLQEPTYDGRYDRLAFNVMTS